MISPTAASPPKIRAVKTAFCVMAVSGPHVTFCLAKVRSHKRINWFLTGLAGRWKLHRRRHPARKSSSIAAKMARGSPSTFAASLNVEHAPQRRPCFQLKIAGRLLLDVTNTDFRTAPSRTPASLRSLGPVLADRELRKVGTSVTAITALTAVVTGVTVLSSATGAECLHCNRPAPLRSRWEQK